MKRSKLLNLRRLIVETSATLDDTEALTGVELFKPWAAGIDVVRGERLRDGEDLYRVEQNHTTQANWPPASTPALYTKVAAPGQILPWKRPTGAQDSYMAGTKVYFPNKGDAIYQNNHDYNTYSPEEYPDWWDKISD